ncbi:endo-alpha-N-acetylgalactosaminidase family protein, partial [Lachnoclostridium sp. An181]|uniref:endo-alpha-N-acetylgalactosaminidase family protein n=1 Tax=Lachnoclostridium sp. An181 TaxID=1965575 RepID=UPI000B3A3537
MKKRIGTRITAMALSTAMIITLLPAQVLANDVTPVTHGDADGWVLQRQSEDTSVELQDGWITPDEDGNGVTIDYGKIVEDTGNEGWVVFDSDEPKYKNSSLEYDITFSEPTQGDWVAVAPATRVTDGKNYEGFAITEGSGLERTGRVNGSESYANIDNLPGLKFEYDKTYHLRMETIDNNITVYVTADGEEQKLTSFESPIGLGESTYGFRIWRGGKKITLDNIERKEIITSSLGRNVEQIEKDKWGTEDVSIPVQFGKGDSISAIYNGDQELEEGQEYEVTDNTLVLKKEYIVSLGSPIQLNIEFAMGSEATLYVIQYEPGKAQEYVWTPDQGIDMWKSISGDGSFELQDDGLHITGTNALVNTLSPLTANGEIEITFESLYDYEGIDMGAIFRADGNNWQGVASTGSEGGEGYWDFLNNGSKSRIIWDGNQNMALGGVADSKVKIRFMNDSVTFWMDDQFAQTSSISQANPNLGNMGVYVDNRGDIIVKKVVFRELLPFEETTGERQLETIENDGLTVRLDADFPRVVDYTLNGKTLNGSEVRYNYVSINTVDYPATATYEKSEDGKSITYHVTPEGIDVTFDVVFTVKDDQIVEMLIKNIVEPEGVRVNTINLPDQPLISANSEQEGAVLDASWVEENARQFRDLKENIADKNVSTTANRSASIPIITANGLSASMYNNVMYGGEEFVFRGFDLENGEKSVGVWNQDFMYRGLDGEKMFPFPSEPDEENLYCRIAITEDTNGDDIMDWQDGANALKKLTDGIIPGGERAARSFFHVGYNFASGAQQPFLKVADNMKRLSNYFDGFSQQLVFKGYQNEGHDSCWGDYQDVNSRAGGAEDMNVAIAEADKLDSNIGIHLNNTGVTPEAKAYGDPTTTSDQPGWVWMDQSRILRRYADMLTGGFDDRLNQLFEQTPELDFVYVDCWGDDRWGEKKLIRNLLENGVEMFGTENGPDFIRFGAWVHHPDCASSISQFVYNSQRDVYNSSPIYWGGYGRSVSMMSWQHNNNINSLVQQFYTEQLPQKYLMCHEVLKVADGVGTFEDNVTSGNWVITKDGRKLTDGQGKIFIPWYAEDSETKNPDEAAKIYHWNTNGGETTWTLPENWSDLENVYLYRTTQTGKQLVDTIDVVDGQVTIDADAKVPYVVYPGEAKTDETEWSVGSPLKDTGFNSRDFSIWEKSGDADIQFNDDGNGVSILTMKGKEEGAVSQTMTGLIPGQKYRLVVEAGATNGKTARLTVETSDGEIHENYVDQVTMSNQYFDNYAKGKMVQRMWVDFVQPEGETTAKVTLSADACDSVSGVATFMETRIVKTAEPDLPEGYVANETFEYVEQGAYGIFNPERSADGAPHLSETHTPYTNDTISGDWSLKLWGERGQGDVTVRTSPSTMRLRPNTEYKMEFDTTSYGRVYVQSESDANDQILNETFDGGHSTYTFVTGDKTDYIVRIERGKVLDNFTVQGDKPIDRTALGKLIAQAKGLDKDVYTPESYEQMTAVVKEAEAVQKNADSTIGEIRDAYKALEKAINDLVAYATAEEKAGLETVIETMKSLDAEDYVQDAKWMTLKAVISVAEKLVEDEKATSPEVADIISRLWDAKDALHANVDRTALQEILAKAQRVDIGTVAEGEELQRFQTALNAAQKTDLKSGVTAEEINAAATELTDAYAAIVLQENAKNNLVASALRRTNIDETRFLESDRQAVVEAEETLSAMKSQSGVKVSDYFEVIDKLENALANELSSSIVKDSSEISSEGFSYSANTEERAQADNGVEMAFDKQGSTFWHSAWNGFTVSASNPAQVTIDMGKVYTINQFAYQRRPGGGNGSVNVYNLYIKQNEGDNWTKVIADGRFGDVDGLQKISFDAVDAKYLMFEVTQGVGNFASAAELMVYEKAADFTALQSTMMAVEKLNKESYLTEGFENLENLYQEAEEMLNVPSTAQEDVDALVTAMKDALAALVEKADDIIVQMLMNVVEEAEQINLDEYDNTAAFEAALETAKAVLLKAEDGEVAKAEVTEVADNLITAQKNLISGETEELSTDILKYTIDLAKTADTTGVIDTVKANFEKALA